MRIFVTGATGWIGAATVDELLTAGHTVVGLARSDRSAAALATKGAQVLHGDLDDLDSLRRGTENADGVVHLANKHDWADPDGTNRTEGAAVRTLVDALAGSNRPLLVANGLTGITPGRATTEDDPSPEIGPDADRGGSENQALAAVDRGVRGMAVRFAPSVHGDGDWGFVSFLAEAARTRGISSWVGDGTAQWSTVHRTDAARLIRLATEQAPAGARLHAAAEIVPTAAIAEALGTALGLPTGSATAEDLGIVGEFFAQTLTADSTRTRDLLGWQPTGPTLLQDILAGSYSGS
jgi:nucleoside-diphosphate-sugar epimerase